MANIRGVILDVDGVIVGETVGVNSPNPHESVIQKLKELKESGITVSLCTAKPHFSIAQIIEDAGLDNLHITDGGSVIIDPIHNKVVKKHVIESDVAAGILKKYLENDVYVEFYTTEGYFLQKSQESEITKGHGQVLQQEPVLLDDIAKESFDHKITKIMPVAKNESEKDRLSELFNEVDSGLTLSWGVHPVILPLQFGIITAPGISKKEGAIAISKDSGIDFENMLGVGDSASDWQFIELCKYGGAMGNAKQDLKDLVLSKGEGNSKVGPSVDEHGILDILDFFIN